MIKIDNRTFKYEVTLGIILHSMFGYIVYREVLTSKSTIGAIM